MYNKIFDSSLLSTAYLPPIEYFAAIANSNKITIEREEIYQKQSYRTRCHIYSGNGILVLNVPVLRSSESGHKIPIKEIKIDYSKPWISQHKRGLEAAYKSSPFFEYYQDDIFSVIDKKETFLIDLNSKLTELFAELIGIDFNLIYTQSYHTANDGNSILDLRDRIHPKNKQESILQELKIEKPYYQVFNSKQGFIPNLSIIDLLCNEGPNSISYLKFRSNR